MALNVKNAMKSVSVVSMSRSQVLAEAATSSALPFRSRIK